MSHIVSRTNREAMGTRDLVWPLPFLNLDSLVTCLSVRLVGKLLAGKVLLSKGHKLLNGLMLVCPACAVRGHQNTVQLPEWALRW